MHPEPQNAPQQRTNQQSRALHLLFKELAVELNSRGLDLRAVLKPGIEIPWDERLVKEHLWKPLQEVMLGKESTTELTTAEVNKVWEVLDRHLLQKHEINMRFPSKESQWFDMLE